MEAAVREHLPWRTCPNDAVVITDSASPLVLEPDGAGKEAASRRCSEMSSLAVVVWPTGWTYLDHGFSLSFQRILLRSLWWLMKDPSLALSTSDGVIICTLFSSLLGCSSSSRRAISAGVSIFLLLSGDEDGV